MKNLLRAFVLSLVVTGAFASSHVNNTISGTHMKSSVMPTPMCAPGDPNACGLCKISNCRS
jgi:hypothetical protein